MSSGSVASHPPITATADVSKRGAAGAATLLPAAAASEAMAQMSCAASWSALSFLLARPSLWQWGRGRAAAQGQSLADFSQVFGALDASRPL
jgi:hypothetical protein